MSKFLRKAGLKAVAVDFVRLLSSRTTTEGQVPPSYGQAAPASFLPMFPALRWQGMAAAHCQRLEGLSLSTLTEAMTLPASDSESAFNTACICIVAWFALSFIPAAIASSKGRSFFGWFFLSLLTTPVITLFLAAVISPDKKTQEKREIKKGTLKRCPACMEAIQKGAIICRFCNFDFNQTSCITSGSQEANHDEASVNRSVRKESFIFHFLNYIWQLISFSFKNHSDYRCPRCHAHYNFKPHLAGQVVNCPSCKRNFSYPTE